MRRKHDFPARTADLALAPGDLGIVQAFVNTRDLEHRTDELKSPQALADWLERRRLLALLLVQHGGRAGEWGYRFAGTPSVMAVQRSSRTSSRNAMSPLRR